MNSFPNLLYETNTVRLILLVPYRNSFYNCYLEIVMREPSTGAKLFVVVGFFMSLVAFLWLSSLPKPIQILPRIGLLCALYCTSGSLAFCWAAIFVYLARKRNWSARSYAWAGLLFVVPALLLLFFGNFRFSGNIGLLWAQALLTTYICRKLAFPGMSLEQINAPEPPVNLFSK
jgi:hypothetical protein